MSGTVETGLVSCSLRPNVRRFVEEYFSGDHAGNATRSYMTVFPEASYNVASVEASTLLKDPNVTEYLRQLHEQARNHTVGRLRRWIDLLPLAQDGIVATAEGRIKNRLLFDACRYICDRALGSPTAMREVVVHDSARVVQALSAFSRRINGPTD